MFDSQVFTETPADGTNGYERAFVWRRIMAIYAAVGLLVGWIAAVVEAWLSAICLFAFGEAVSDTIAVYRANRQTGLRDASVSDGGVSVQRSHE
jgi:hypothetical protein